MNWPRPLLRRGRAHIPLPPPHPPSCISSASSGLFPGAWTCAVIFWIYTQDPHPAPSLNSRLTSTVSLRPALGSLLGLSTQRGSRASPLSSPGTFLPRLPSGQQPGVSWALPPPAPSAFPSLQGLATLLFLAWEAWVRCWPLFSEPASCGRCRAAPAPQATSSGRLSRQAQS